MCGLKERAVRNALGLAEERGLIEKTGTANGQRGVCNVYRMTTTGTTVPPVDDNHRHDGAAGDDETTGTAVPNHRHGDDQTTGTAVPPTNVGPTQDQRKSVLAFETQPHVDDGAARDEPLDVEVISDPANDARQIEPESGERPEPSDVAARERGQERGRSNPVDVSASRLVSTLVPAGFPAAVKTALRLKASELIRGDGVPPDVVAEAIRRWLARPGLGVPMLAPIASDVLREGTAPAPRSKIGDWANFTNRLDEIEREYLERHPDGVGLDQHLAAVMARESGPAPRSKLRDWHELAERVAAEEEQEPDPPLAIEAKAAPLPKPSPPPWLPGPNGEPRCRVHAHLPATPPDCAGCRAAAEIAAGEAS